MQYDAIVLGAGVSGLVSASVLAKGRKKRVLLTDSYGVAGGNHIAIDIGDMTFDIGSFFFQNDSPLLTHFSELLPIYLDIGSYSVSRLTPFGIVARYPVDMRRELFGVGFVEFTKILSSLLWARLTVDRDRNAETFTVYWIGHRFARRSGLLNYLARFYGTPPAQIEAIFARKRMGWIANPARLLLESRKSAKPKAAINRQLIRPRQGFGMLYAVAVDVLRAKGVKCELGVQMQAIERLPDGRMRVHTTGGAHEAPLLLSTIPVNQTLRLCGLPEEQGIRSASLLSLFFSFRGNRAFSSNVLYNFSESGLWKRLTVYSDFYGPVDGRTYFTVEVICNDDSVGPEHAQVDFVQHIEKYGILTGDLRLEGSRVTFDAYPVYLDGASLAAERAIRTLRDHGVLSYGRQGGFDYQPTARVSTLVAEEQISRIPVDSAKD